jgi:hypothetical protein
VQATSSLLWSNSSSNSFWLEFIGFAWSVNAQLMANEGSKRVRAVTAGVLVACQARHIGIDLDELAAFGSPQSGNGTRGGVVSGQIDQSPTPLKGECAMPASSRIRFALCFSVGLGLLLTACQPAASVAQVVPTNTVAPTIQVAASVAPSATNTRVPDTPTAVPSNTATARPTDTATTPPTATTSPTVAPTQTAAPTATKKPTARPTARPQPTNPPQPTSPPVVASVYSTASGGPQGYVSRLTCTQPGNVPCQSVMAAGDKAFAIRLEALDDAVPAIFVPFGLSVEKDGANAANMYMTVVSGWLNPGEYALLGTSRNFSQPGHYVIRTNGCFVTQATYPNCTWGTVDGTVVTFDIQ